MTTRQIELYSPQYYALCALGGFFGTGIIHTSLVPLDILKCRKQVGLKTSIRQILATEGPRGLTLGWAPTFVGHSLKGTVKMSLYEYFKQFYADLAGPENANRYKDALYLSGSASAELIAGLFLCPFEAVKVRIQTADPSKVPRTFPTTLRAGLPTILSGEGLAGLYKGLIPLWSRQIPYTMMKFWAFERTVEALYTHVVPKPKAECSSTEQLAVSFAGGLIAGIFCAVVSHPADSVVSKLNHYSTRPPIRRILAEMGPLGIWRGLSLRIAMVGALTAAQWLSYDSFKVAVGLPTTGGHQR